MVRHATFQSEAIRTAMSDFWDFPACAKHDEIHEGTHDRLYLGALADSETGIEKVGRDAYIIYGKQEALLMRPVTFIYRLGLDLLEAFLSLHE